MAVDERFVLKFVEKIVGLELASCQNPSLSVKVYQI